MTEDQTVESSGHQSIPSFEDYRLDTAVVSSISEIDTFSFFVRYPPGLLLTRGENLEDLVTTVVEAIIPILRETGIHSAHNLTVRSQHKSSEKPDARVNDTQALASIIQDNGADSFAIDIFDDRLLLRKTTSTFLDFYEWYRKVVPLFPRVELAFRRRNERLTQRTIEAVETSFLFKINFSDFTKLRGNSGVSSNVKVLETLIPNIPLTNGSSELSTQDFYRLDLTISRLENLGDQEAPAWRNCWYSIEAPFNESGRFLVFSAEMRNSSLVNLRDTSRNAPRKAIPFDGVISPDVDRALLKFLKDRALENFMAKVVENWQFMTQRRV